MTVSFLHKPFTADELGRALRIVLDKDEAY
jgi:hypothetical protein